MPAAVAVPAVLGAAGLYSANQQQNEARRAQERALKAAQNADVPRAAALAKMLETAQGYDPRAETDAAVQRAEAVSTRALTNGLSNLSARFRSAGGSPGGDSEFGIRAQDVANRTLDPLRAFVADQRAGETSRKLGALQTVTGAPAGNVAPAYFQYAANMPQGNSGASLQLFTQALQGLGGQGGKKGAGGSGDQAGRAGGVWSGVKPPAPDYGYGMGGYE